MIKEVTLQVGMKKNVHIIFSDALNEVKKNTKCRNESEIRNYEMQKITPGLKQGDSLIHRINNLPM